MQIIPINSHLLHLKLNPCNFGEANSFKLVTPLTSIGNSPNDVLWEGEFLAHQVTPQQLLKNPDIEIYLV